VAESQATGSNNGPAEGAAKPKRNPRVIAVVVVLVVVAAIMAVRAVLWGRGHVSTDDAYVTGNLVSVSPSISGTLIELKVREGDVVKKGQLIARLDPAGPEASLRQAQANLQAALSMIPQAERNLEYQRLATQAAIEKSRAALAAQQARTGGAHHQLELAGSTYRNQVIQANAQVSAAEAQYEQAQAQVLSARAARENLVQAVETARAFLSTAEQQVQTATKVAQAASRRTAATADLAEHAKRDAVRYESLFKQDAVSEQTYDNARTTADNLVQQLLAAQADSAQADSQVEAARRAVITAKSQLAQAQKAVEQGSAQVAAAQRAADATKAQITVAKAGLGLAQGNASQVGVQRSNFDTNADQSGESKADLSTAMAGQSQIEIRKSQIDTYRAQVKQAEAAVANAEVTMKNTYIYAPCDGEVVRKDSNEGQTVAPGTSVVTITQGNDIWVDANFKETQLGAVKVGQEADVEVDAFPGRTFKGKVQSIRQATGASTALLPPDNATGNFTKVVQRIPVRIEFDGHGEDLSVVRRGMSVTATITTEGPKS
jgi:membrane fusion protein, multidrug efflux system